MLVVIDAKTNAIESNKQKHNREFIKILIFDCTDPCIYYIGTFLTWNGYAVWENEHFGQILQCMILPVLFLRVCLKFVKLSTPKNYYLKALLSVQHEVLLLSLPSHIWEDFPNFEDLRLMAKVDRTFSPQILVLLKWFFPNRP